MSVLLPFTGWATDNSANEVPNAFTTLHSYPANIVLSENVNNFKFEPLLSTSTPAYARTTIQVIGYVAVGETISIQSDLGTIVLTASVTPTVNEFYTEAVTTSTPTYLAAVAYSIADAISQSLAFNSNYNISLTGTQVTVTAKQYGELPDMTSSTTSANVFVLSFGGVSEYESQNVIDYQGFAQVYAGRENYQETVNKYDSQLLDSYILDTGMADVNTVFPVVKNFIEPVKPYKVLTPNENYYAMDLGLTNTGLAVEELDSFGNKKRVLIPYFVAYGDSFKYITNGQRKNFVRGVSPVRWMQLGAFDYLMPYDMTDYVWIPDSTKQFKFLTSCPAKKTVSYDTHEYVQMICQKSTKNFDFNVQVMYNFYDGTSVLDNVTQMTYNALTGNVSIDVSPTTLGIQAIETANGKLVDSYKVRIRWQYKQLPTAVVAYSEWQSYVMDRTCYRNKEQVIFLNELGAWDALEFRGEIEESLNREVLQIERNLPANANSLDSVSTEVKLNINTKAVSDYSLRSGLINDSHINWVKKMLESSSVFIWDDTINKYRSIVIKDYKWSNNTIPTADSLTITFNYSTDNNTIRR